jgi:hypothetical protein
MVWTDEQVNNVIYALLDSAESAGWEIQIMPPTLSSKGAVVIRGEKPFRASSNEESELALEAFERMVSELYFVQQKSGIMHRVTPEGRAALQKHRQQKKSAMRKWNLIGVSYGKEEAKSLEEWSNKFDATVGLVIQEPAFRDNAAQVVEKYKNASVAGFLICDTNAFKPNTLADLYKTAKALNFYLLATNRGDEPLTDDDIHEELTSVPTPITINVHGNQNVIATHGGVNQQIANHLEIIQETNPDIATVLKARG